MKIPLTRPYFGKEELMAIKRVLDSRYVAQGPTTKEFERKFAKYLGIKYVLSTSSCTAALHIALSAIRIKPGDEVILPTYTYPATGNVVALIGAKPVLVDIDSETFTIDPEKIKEAITKKTKAIMPVHSFGHIADMDAIVNIAEDNGLFVIEDAACALGSKYKNKVAGQFGGIACFSFHPRKILTTGEGGMFVTDDDKLAEHAALLKDHGQKRINNKVIFEEFGYNYRMSDILAAVGLVQLKHFDELLKKRIRLAETYNKALSKIRGLKPQKIIKDVKTNYQSYVALVGEEYGMSRDELIAKLAKKGIQAQIGTYALHLEPSFQRLGYKKGDFTIAEKVFETAISLPLYADMEDEEIRYVVSNL